PPSSTSPPSLYQCDGAPRDLHSFPTRRSSDLAAVGLTSRSRDAGGEPGGDQPLPQLGRLQHPAAVGGTHPGLRQMRRGDHFLRRSEEHTSELQSRENLVCRLLLEKKKRSQRHK